MNKNNSIGGCESAIIRLEKKEDHRKVEELVRESFWNVYRPGCLEHYVLHCLRNDPDFVPELDFVMELTSGVNNAEENNGSCDGKPFSAAPGTKTAFAKEDTGREGLLIGQNVFVKAVIQADPTEEFPEGRKVPIMTMGPICIAPEYKRKGYGKKLLDYSLEKAKELGCGAVCFEGNIGFYGKSGFTYASEFGIRYHGLPEGEDASFFLCRELIPGYLSGITGEYATPKGYFVCEEDPEGFDAFEATFPVKEKLVLPGQLI